MLVYFWYFALKMSSSDSENESETLSQALNMLEIDPDKYEWIEIKNFNSIIII